jgi:glycosyltransferase involved in cell wall biosynthesis
LNVNLLSIRIGHHAARSGYDQLAEYLARHLDVRELDYYLPRRLPDRAWQWISDRSAWVARRAGMDWYDLWAFNLEIVAAARMLRTDGEIYHVLYGENNYRALGMLRRLAGGRRHRLVCTFHQPPEVFERVVRSRQALKQVDAIVAVASNQVPYFASFVGEQRVFVVPLGVDTEHYRPSSPEPSNPRTCLFVGRWLRDFELLEKVIRWVTVREPSVRFRLVLSDEHVAAFGGLDNVDALNGISDAALLEAYQSAGLLLMPLTDCTANCALLEGMACGLPVIATDVGGIRDYVDPSCAALVPPGDAGAMGEAIIAVVSDDRRRAELGRASRLQALQFDWRRIAERMASVYAGIAR